VQGVLGIQIPWPKWGKRTYVHARRRKQVIALSAAMGVAACGRVDGVGIEKKWKVPALCAGKLPTIRHKEEGKTSKEATTPRSEGNGSKYRCGKSRLRKTAKN